MKKLFSDHPFAAMLLTSCLTCFGIFALFVGGLFVMGVGLSQALSGLGEGTKVTELSAYQHLDGNKSSDNKVLVIPIEGIILTDRPKDSFFSLFDFGYTYGYEIKEQLGRAATDPKVKAVVLQIDFPGGTITGANAISDGVKYLRHSAKKPVIAYTNGLAASGGYWAAASAESIIADQGTLVGSIGVIMGPFKYYDKVIAEGDVVTENGIDSFYITAGLDKDLGDPYKKMSEASKKKLQDGINDEYEKFVTHVATTRGIEKESIKKDIGAMIYGAEEAQNLRLIDDIGTKQAAYIKAAQKANLSTSDYEVVTFQYNDFWSSLAGSKLIGAKPATCLLCNKMLYLYEGTLEE